MAKKKLKHRMKRITQHQITKKHLRSGSKEAKRILLMENPHCDICGSSKNLELHHVKMIRWGYPTDINYCRLLCHDCHKRYHEYDRYLNMLHSQGNMDFLAIYEKIKKQIQTRYILP